METKKIFDMGQTRSQQGKESVLTPMTYKRITIGGASPEEEKPKKKGPTQRQIEYKKRQREQRIETLERRIKIQNRKVKLMADGLMKVRMAGRLNKLISELKSLEGE